MATLTSSAAVSRVSSSADTLMRSGINPYTLSSVISNISSSLSANNPGLSGCEILVETLLEVVSILVHMMNSAQVGYPSGNAADIASGVAIAVSKGF